MRYVLEMNERQASIVKKALEFYSRMRIGQWRELTDICLDFTDEDYCKKKDFVDDWLIRLRSVIYPELPVDRGASYGIGRFPDADIAWEVYCSIRHCMAWAKHPEGGWTVDFDKPMSIMGNEIAKCTAKEDKDASK